jgi:hypothetical protein
MRPVERRASGGRTDRPPKGWTVQESTGVVMVAPAPGGEQNAGPDQAGEVMDEIFLAPGIGRPRDHPPDDTAALHGLAQRHDTGIAGQPLCAALDAKGLVEADAEGLYRLSRGVFQWLLSDLVQQLDPAELSRARQPFPRTWINWAGFHRVRGHCLLCSPLINEIRVRGGQ